MRDIPLKILVADDESEVLEIMARKLRGEGFFVVTAGDGQEAWQKIQAEAPDIILLDLVMPKMSGFEVLKQLREDPPADKWQPVIIISAKSELEDLQQGFSLEADHYLTKPCNFEDVLKAIRLMVSLLPQRKSRQEIDQEKY